MAYVTGSVTTAQILIFRTEEKRIQFPCHFQPVSQKAVKKILFLSLIMSCGFQI